MTLAGEVKRAYQREWLHRRRQAWAEGKRCHFCGDEIDPDHYHVHHLDPDLKVSHRIWSWSQARLEAELAKCRPACPDCHRQYSVADQIKPLEHGTVHGYKRRRCRCPECKSAWAAFMREFRKEWNEKSEKESAKDPDPNPPLDPTQTGDLGQSGQARYRYPIHP